MGNCLVDGVSEAIYFLMQVRCVWTGGGSIIGCTANDNVLASLE